MAHDRNGTEIQVGDPVNIPGVITNIDEPLSGSNALVTVRVVPLPVSDAETYVNVGSAQVVKS